MLPYLFRRVLLAVPTLLGVSLLAFMAIRLIPGDPAVLMAGERASDEVVEEIRHAYGFDRPVYVQYLAYMARLLQGDLGVSTRDWQPVARTLIHRFRNTLALAGVSFVMAAVLGVSTGVLCAIRPRTVFDTANMMLGLLGLSMPAYWLGLMLMLAFSVKLRWLPVGGIGTISHLVLPTLTLSMANLGIVARLTRSGVLEVIGQDYIRTARAKGLAELRVMLNHALRNALIPIVTILGLGMGALLSGAVVTETVFSWPGMGRLLIDSIFARDYPTVQAAILLLAVLAFAINLLVDLTYAFLDPRIRYA